MLIPRRLTATPHALILVGPTSLRTQIQAARLELERRGWETLVLRVATSPGPTALEELGLRWEDCDLAVFLDVPDALRLLLEARTRRPVLVMAEDPPERLVG